MSFFKVEDPIVGSGSSPSSPTRVQVWANNVTYSDGQIVTFNGSQYVANGSPPVGIAPPIEVATPQVPGQPKWNLGARGRSLPKEYDDTTTYYQDQVVTYLGGTFVLDAPTVPLGTRPGRDKQWTRLSETLTAAEAEQVSSANLSNFFINTTSAIVGNMDEVPRVRHHWVRISISAIVGGGQLFVMTFPRAIKSQARPQITVQPSDSGSATMFLFAVAIISGNEVTGYSLRINSAIGPGTYEALITVKEMIDQVDVP